MIAQAPREKDNQQFRGRLLDDKEGGWSHAPLFQRSRMVSTAIHRQQAHISEAAGGCPSESRGVTDMTEERTTSVDFAYY